MAQRRCGVFKKSLAYRYPDVAAEWHPTRNSKRPWEVAGRAGSKAWWVCGTCGWEWEAPVSRRTGGNGCRHCNPGGFDPTKPGFLYLYLDTQTNPWLKIGITNGPRFQQWDKRKWKPIAVWRYESGNGAQDAEQEVLEKLWKDYLSLGKLRNDQEDPDHLSNDGYTECIKLDELQKNCPQKVDSGGCRHTTNDHSVCGWMLWKIHDIARCKGGKVDNKEERSKDLIEFFTQLYSRLFCGFSWWCPLPSRCRRSPCGTPQESRRPASDGSGPYRL